MKRKGEEVRESPAYAPAKAVKGRVPRLRFPEFQKAGEWREGKISSVCEINPAVKSLPDSFIYIDLESVSSGILLERKRHQRNAAPSRAQRLLREGDVIFQLVRPYQRNNLLCRFVDGESYVASTGYAQLRPRESSEYLYQLLHTDDFVNRVLSKCTGSSYPAITSGELGEIPASFPNLGEQRRIAACLSSLDSLLAAQAKKLEALKAYKKGLLQRLFPAKGEGRPRLRFPEFRKAGEWEEKSLGSFSAIVRGGSPRPIEAYLTTASEGLNWLKIGDLDQESKYVTATKEKVLPSAIKKTREVFPGDLILSNSMSFGRPYILRIQTCIHDGWIAVSNIIDGVDTEFLYYSILSSSCQKYFTNNAAGAVVQNLNADIIKLLPIALPSLPEQKKIAATLSSLDSLLAAQGRKLEALREHKRGLLQGLFPRAEEE